MYIETIEAVNFKGLNFCYDLGPLTLIVGDNFSGKTAIGDAIGVGLIGHDPVLGKRNMDTFRFSGGPKMEIRLKAGELLLEHVWNKTTDGVTYKKKWPAELESVPTELLSLQEYLYGTTAAQRVAAIFSRIDMSKFKDEPLVEKVAALEVLPTAVSKPIVERVTGELKKSIERRDKLNVTVQDWIAKQIEDWKAARKTAAQEAKLEAARITAARSVLNGFPGIPKDRSADIARVNEEVAEVNKTIGALEEKCSTWKKGSKRRAELQAYCEDQGWLSELLEDWMQAVELEGKRLNRALKPVKGVKGSTVTLAGDRSRLAAEYRALSEKISDLQTRVTEAGKGVKALQESTCPCCKKKGAACRSLKQQIKVAEKGNAALNSAIKEAEAERAGIEKEGKAIKAQSAVAGANAEIEAQLAELERKASVYRELSALGSATAPKESDEIAGITAKKAAALKELDRLAAEQGAFHDYSKHQQTCKDGERLSIFHQTEASVLDKAVAVLEETREAMVRDGFNKILNKAKWFTDGILESPLVYRDGELGRMKGSVFISHEVFSGTEKLLAYAGISVALAQDSPIKLVRLDEMGRLLPANKTKVVQRMKELVRSGNIDQAILIDVDANDYQGANFDQIIDLQK